MSIQDDFIPRSKRDWDMVRADLLSRSGWLCDYCDAPLAWKGSEIDHIIPRRQGGTDHYVNFAIACIHCNRSKGGRNSYEWMDPQSYAEEFGE